jgi:DNA helicase-2/ATP-dependent DNA helicase PcrA
VLRERWYDRQRSVIELVEPVPQTPPAYAGPVWHLDPTLLVDADILGHLVWSNSVDLRQPERPAYRWLEAALAAGARVGGPADVLLGDDAPAWCDGGPVGTVRAADVGGTAIVHRLSLERAATTPWGTDHVRPAGGLAPDQLAAVTHPGGAARVIAPAGSGKTRVLAERARLLVTGWRVPASAVCLLAFNERAAAEMRERTSDLPGLQVRTLNALGLAVVDGREPFAHRGRGYQVLDERAVRDVLGGLVSVPRRRNTDPLAPWIDALAEVRLGLRDPREVEAAYDGEVDGLAEVIERYRSVLAARHVVDFDEQIVGAIEVLLAEPLIRAVAQQACRLLLVDEFQDLAPAHLLLVRLLASPELAVFGVGDDDQTIYGFSGATPEWLISYRSLFPAAGDHPLEVNYRCPPAVVDGARSLLARNRRRVPKTIRAAPGRATSPDALRVVITDDTVGATADAVAGALTSGAAPSDIAVLTRVNAILAAPQVMLRHRGIAVQQAIDERWLDRTGVRSALAWVRLAVEPAHLAAADLREAARRPARGRSAKLVDWICEQPSLTALGRLAARLNGRDAAKVAQLVEDISRLSRVATQGDSAAVLTAVRGLGLDESMGALDGYQRTPKHSGHLDDLDALIELATLCSAPREFPSWLRAELRHAGNADGVRLATVHRVKGREWPHVVVHDATADQLPHRLASDIEEERRVFHVAITRCSTTCTIVAPARSPSPFLAELRGETPQIRPSGRRTDPQPAQTSSLASVGPDGPALQALKAWRSGRAKADGVPAFVVFHDTTLHEIALRRPKTLADLTRVKGLGPTKLDRYGDELLAIVAALP